MYCLSCGGEVAYTSPQCPHCRVDLSFPGHVYGDHVSQVLQAVEAACADELGLAEAESVYRQFLVLSDDFLRYWRLDTHPQISLRVAALPAEAQVGFVELEASLDDLRQARELYERGFAQNCRKTLIEANFELEAFFRRSCAGIARLRRLLAGPLAG
jgi:hypothetical protein